MSKFIQGARMTIEQVVLDSQGLLVSWLSEGEEGCVRHIASISLEALMSGEEADVEEGVMQLDAVDQLMAKEAIEKAMNRRKILDADEFFERKRPSH